MSMAGRCTPNDRSPEEQNRTVAAFTCLGLLILAVILYMSLSIKHVTVVMGKRTVSWHTFAPTVGDVVREAGIKANSGPVINPDKLREGESVSYLTLSPGPATRLKDGMCIRVYLDIVEKKTEEIILPASTVRQWDIFMEPGHERVIKPGKAGRLINTVVSRYRDGRMVSRQKTGSRQVCPPSPRVIACGSYEPVSRMGHTRIGQPLKVVATAYTHTGYRTAVGARTRRGIVAVDPKVIPLGTPMFIEGYGYAVAADTGAAIKGRRIDVFMESYTETVKWGRRTVKVYVLNRQ